MQQAPLSCQQLLKHKIKAAKQREKPKQKKSSMHEIFPFGNGKLWACVHVCGCGDRVCVCMCLKPTVCDICI